MPIDIDRYVIIVKGTEACAYHDDVPVKYLHTGDTIFKTYVPEWWARDYSSYVSFVNCVQRLWKHSWIQAIKLVRSVSGLGLKDSKEFTEDLARWPL